MSCDCPDPILGEKHPSGIVVGCRCLSWKRLEDGCDCIAPQCPESRIEVRYCEPRWEEFDPPLRLKSGATLRIKFQLKEE